MNITANPIAPTVFIGNTILPSSVRERERARAHAHLHAYYPDRLPERGAARAIVRAGEAMPRIGNVMAVAFCRLEKSENTLDFY
jgi:hypothetical protein